MSKTYYRNRKMEFERIRESYEEDHLPKNVPEECQWISMSGWSWDAAVSKCSKKHGIAKHNHSLKREYTKFHCDKMTNWSNPVGTAHEQTSRCHRIKHDATHRRRHKMKEETRKIYESSLHE